MSHLNTSLEEIQGCSERDKRGKANTPRWRTHDTQTEVILQRPPKRSCRRAYTPLKTTLVAFGDRTRTVLKRPGGVSVASFISFFYSMSTRILLELNVSCRPSSALISAEDARIITHFIIYIYIYFFRAYLTTAGYSKSISFEATQARVVATPCPIDLSPRARSLRCCGCKKLGS